MGNGYATLVKPRSKSPGKSVALPGYSMIIVMYKSYVIIGLLLCLTLNSTSIAFAEPEADKTVKVQSCDTSDALKKAAPLDSENINGLTKQIQNEGTTDAKPASAMNSSSTKNNSATSLAAEQLQEPSLLKEKLKKHWIRSTKMRLRRHVNQ